LRQERELFLATLINQNFVKMAVFYKLSTFVFRLCILKSINILDFRVEEGNEWKNYKWNITILTKFSLYNTSQTIMILSPQMLQNLLSSNSKPQFKDYTLFSIILNLQQMIWDISLMYLKTQSVI